MNALGTALLAFGITLLGAFGGVALRRALPEQHLGDETKDMLRLGAGLIGTIAALVLGLLIATAKSEYASLSGHVQHLTADVILLDQLLAQYGPEATPAREVLRQALDPLVERIWQEGRTGAANRPFEMTKSGEQVILRVIVKIEQLTPQNEIQRMFRDRSVNIANDAAQTRLILFEQSDNAIPVPFLAVLIFWLSIIFSSFGMFSRVNTTAVAGLIIFSASAAGALYLVLDLSSPFTGLMQIPSAPLRNALAPL